MGSEPASRSGAGAHQLATVEDFSLPVDLRARGMGADVCSVALRQGCVARGLCWLHKQLEHELVTWQH